MKHMKILISGILALSMLLVQVGGAFATPALQDATPISGTVKSITLETDPNTGITTVLVEVASEDQGIQTVRIDQQTGEWLGLITLDVDGNPMINDLALGQPVDIDPATVLVNQEQVRHPVANALETFFSELIPGLDYDAIMAAREQGAGFGVIAQALWLTMKIGGDSDLFRALVDAKQNNDYSYFETYTLPDGGSPMNWGQLRKAILNTEKKQNLGNVMSNKDNNGNSNNGNPPDKNKNQDNNKDKNKEKTNNGNSNKNGKGKNK